MTLKLYFHPLSSYCQKALIAFYEKDLPFEPHIVDLGDPAQAAELKALWPIGKFPVLRDDARNVTVAEATVIIEYLDLHYPGRVRLVPEDADQAWQTRMRDRVFDLYVDEQMQTMVGNRRRPDDSKDPLGVSFAKARLTSALGMIDAEMAGRTNVSGTSTDNWTMGEAFTMADCAAAPALFYANQVMPFGDSHPHAMRYFERLTQRPSYARVQREAEPYFHLFPKS
ncbi:glutathione S-transferase family protein [Bradyrhizobium prioriisuperbiae]|uniref:glutathione S-transferase family protein n=1 Tax=Bradyrhizobium prioriisuperbiae TaxID=2854389 RepID=UPI0028E9DDD5|nr:glutathione S-transferase family protein [Bradyrhizobium prioritasuperba]